MCRSKIRAWAAEDRHGLQPQGVSQAIGRCDGTGPASNVTIRAEVLKRVYDDLVTDAEVQLLFETDLIAVECDRGQVALAVLAAKSGIFAVKARMFLDCTGDGDLAAWAGAPFEKGDEHGNMMAGTLCSLWADVDWPAAA